MSQSPAQPGHSPAQPHHSSDTQERLRQLISRRGVPELLVAAVALLTFLGTAGFAFVYDDRAQVVNNPEITTWHRVLGYFGGDVWTTYDPTHVQNYYRPLFFVWFRINYLLFHLNPMGWHLAAVALHVVVSVLAFRLCLNLTSDRTLALMAALLFAAHPIHIESIAWISGTTDPLMCVFLIGSALCFLRWLRAGGIGSLLATATLFAAALLVKEPAIMLLPLLALLAVLYAPGAGEAASASKRDAADEAVASGLARRVTSKAALLGGVLPLAVLAAAYLALRAHLLGSAAHAVNQLTAAQILLTLPGIAFFYMRQSLVPVGLSILYDLPAQSQPTWNGFWMPLLVVAAFGFLLAWWCARPNRLRPALLVAAAVWVLWILPELNLQWMPIGELAHDRYLYLPVLGLCLMVAIALRQWNDGDASTASDVAQGAVRDAEPGLALGPSQRIAFVCLLAVLLTGTVLQEAFCASDLLIWSRAARTAPHSAIAFANLGTVLLERGDSARGLAALERALELDPSSHTANFNIGFELYNRHDYASAEPYVARSIQVAPGLAEGYRLLGSIELRLGHADLAEPLMRKAVALAPRQEGYHLALALVLLERGDRQGAAQEFRRELELFPSNPVPQQALRQLGPGF
jgi:tetratricopeptide (TPR) repeat protein